jgi:rhamnogalacturonyl hydrolase YesR
MVLARPAAGSLVVWFVTLTALAPAAASAATTTRFLQAEGATFNGACTLDTNQAGFTGTSFVNCPNDTTSFIKWTAVRVQSTGTKRLGFRFANGTTTNRAAELQVNGVVVNANLAFNPTGAFTTWATVTVDVAVNAGNNTVQLRGTVASVGLANIDRLDVAEISEVTPDWGIAMVESTMLRSPTPAALGSWGYANALRLHGIYRTYQRVGDPRYLAYVKAWVDGVVGSQGNLYTTTTKTTIRTLDVLDNIEPGSLIMDVYDNYPQANYRTALQTVRNRFTDASNTSGGQPTWSSAYPRTSDGGFWHGNNKPGELWLDGIFMGQTFLHRYGQKFGGADKIYADNEGTQQLIIQFNHQKDNATGLFFHAYDEQGDPVWPLAPGTHHSQEFWCRAMGWYGVSLVEELGVLDPNHVSRSQLISILQGLVAAWGAYQDPATGRWFQIVNKGANPANWTETSCSSMYSYVISRAVKAGFVDPSFATTASNGYAGVLQKIAFGADVTLAADLTNITDISEGTDVGDEASYFARQRPVNDNHGLGAFLMMYEHFAATLAAPTGLAANDGAGQAALVWTDGSSNETGFKIERKPLGTPDSSFVDVAQTAAGVTSYNDVTTPGSYTYRVRAFNDLTYSAYSNADDATVTVGQGPAAPSNLAVVVTGGISAALTWVDNSSSETGFRVERKVSAGSYATLATKAANITTHTDGLSPGSYSYRVIATGSPDSAPSNEVVVVIGNPAADAYVRSGNPTTNFGTATTLEVKSTNTATTRRNAFLRFSLAGLGTNVTSARLRLYGNAATTAKATSVYAVADVAWGETSIVWDYPTVGAGGPALGSPALATQTVGTTAGWVEWDVTTYVQQQRTAGASLLGLGVKSGVVNDEGQTTFNAREGTNKPVLVVSSGP